MAQGQNRGGQRRQQPAQQQGGHQVQPRTENEMISIEEQRRASFNALMRGVDGMKHQIGAVLPKEMNFPTFRTIILIALRKNRDLLDCTPASIINACLSAAWDGLSPDGREGAMIPSKNYGVPEARWNPMVAGLRKQILKGGQVADLITTLVYANEVKEKVEHEDGVVRPRFYVSAGSDPKIMHVPITSEVERGEPIAAYAVAFFHDGRRPTFEVMYKGEIEAVRDMGQSGPVWKGAAKLEMWRKTVVRRFRKSLPGGNDIIDMEARELFPAFSGDQNAAALVAPPRPKRPDEESPAQIADQQGADNGTPMDFGSVDTSRFAAVREEVEHDAETGELRQQAKSVESPAEIGRSSDGDKQKTPETGEFANRADSHPQQGAKPAAKQPLPADQVEWEGWADDTLKALKGCENIDAVNALRREVNPVLEQAPKPILDAVTGRFQDAIADLIG